MISKEILKKIRKIQIATSRAVKSDFAGRYHSVFKGKGMEFHEVREYVPGDEIRSIDWNVTARTGHPFVKKFIEERELTVIVLLDASLSCHFGSLSSTKNQIAAEICSILAFSAVNNNDKVGLVLFTDRIEKVVVPRKGIKNVLRVIREAIYHKPQGKGTDIGLALRHLNRVLKRRAIVFLISDFFDNNFKKILSVSNKRHDVIAINIIDEREIEMPCVGLVRLRDTETGEESVIDTSDYRFRKDYKIDFLKRQKQNKQLFASVGVDFINIYTHRPYITELIRFFASRSKRLA
jgi:uncharacterized protein (DUF58 family)